VRRALAVAAIGALGAGVLGGCGSSGKSSKSNAGSTGVTVALQAMNTTYTPTAVPLKAGQKVTFVVTNGDQIEHNLTVKDLKINADVAGGKTTKATATPAAGTYEFHCEYHPQQMTGTITVT
jgi:plastocyanin